MEDEKIKQALRYLISTHKKQRQIIRWLEANAKVKACAVISADTGEDGIFILDGFLDVCNMTGAHISKSELDGYTKSEANIGGVRVYALEDSE